MEGLRIREDTSSNNATTALVHYKGRECEEFVVIYEFLHKETASPSCCEASADATIASDRFRPARDERYEHRSKKHHCNNRPLFIVNLMENEFVRKEASRGQASRSHVERVPVRRFIQESLKLLRPYDAQSSGFLMPRIVPKPWGYEEWIVLNKHYVMKRLSIKRGEVFSTKYHETLMKTFIVGSGTCRVLLGDEGNVEPSRAKWYSLNEGECVHVNPRTIHTFEAIDDVVLFEVSTPQLRDSVRVHDKYGRI